MVPLLWWDYQVRLLYLIMVLWIAGRALAYALIGLSPPSILMAGRTHCLRRFDHARTVTIRKYHYLMHKVMASRSAKIDLQHGYVSLSS